jgi:colicin import membrane protein
MKAGTTMAILDKELAQATKMAQQANQRVEKLRKRLVSESEKSHAKLKRELAAARKRHSTANARLKKARATLRKRTTPDNQKKVDALMKQVQGLGDSVADVAKAAYAAAEKLVTVKTDAVLEERKARAANQAANMVERAAARPKKKPAKKKAAAKKKPAAKKKAAPKKKAAAKKKAAPKRKAAAKRKAAPKRKAAARR